MNNQFYYENQLVSSRKEIKEEAYIETKINQENNLVESPRKPNENTPQTQKAIITLMYNGVPLTNSKGELITIGVDDLKYSDKNEQNVQINLRLSSPSINNFVCGQQNEEDDKE